MENEINNHMVDTIAELEEKLFSLNENSEKIYKLIQTIKLISGVDSPKYPSNYIKTGDVKEIVLKVLKTNIPLTSKEIYDLIYKDLGIENILYNGLCSAIGILKKDGKITKIGKNKYGITP
jgi:hypothetical protein